MLLSQRTKACFYFVICTLEVCDNFFVNTMLMSLLFKVMDAKGEKSLALFPAKFQKSMWIKRGIIMSCCSRLIDWSLFVGVELTSRIFIHELTETD